MYQSLSVRRVTSAQRVAARFERQGADRWKDDDFLPTVAKAIQTHSRLNAWIKKFPRVLARAEREADGLEPGWVWQTRLVDYWKEWDKFEGPLKAADEVFDWLYVASERIADNANMARDATYDPPREARIEHGFSKFEFFPHPKMGREHIAYPVANLKEWATAMEKWTEDSVKVLKTEAKRAKRKLTR